VSETRAGEPFNPYMVIDIPRKSHGEDAPPFIYPSSSGTWLGVFDGMGGAGATRYETPNGKQSGAYIASRTAANALFNWLVSGTHPQVPLNDQIYEVVRSSLSARASELSAEPSRLKSKLIRTLPTTLALASISAASEPNRVRVEAFWTGDSRVYVQSAWGLLQLTTDHLSTSLDAFENLTQDSPLSNCASADQDFFVESLPITCQVPLIAIAATDGCFGYVKSPLFFEDLLLGTLFSSHSTTEWSHLLGESLSKITADDVSLAAVVVGVNSFDGLKQQLRKRRDSISAQATRLREAEARSVAAAAAAIRSREEFEASLRTTWESYRENYEAKFRTYRSSGGS